VPILFIGDSTDRLIQQDICDLGKMVGARVDPIGYDTDQTTLRVGLMPSSLASMIIAFRLFAALRLWFMSILFVRDLTDCLI